MKKTACLMIMAAVALSAGAAEIAFTGADASAPTDLAAPGNWVGGALPGSGDVGVVDSIDRGSMTVKVHFEDDRVAEYGADQLSDIALAYAVSVHKSQGSEFRVVIVVASQYNPMVLNKNLLYTAVTRAKDMVVLVGNKRTFQYMVRNKRTERRFTALVRFIDEYRQE